MNNYYFKVDLFDKDGKKAFIANKKVVVRAESPKEASEKLVAYYIDYQIKHHMKGTVDEVI
jgi:hypothetical protein